MTLSTEHLQQPSNEIEKLRKANETLRDEIAFLKEQLEWFKRQIFDQKAEKFIDPDNQQLCFEGFDSLNSTTVEEKKPVAAHTRKKRQVTGKDKISYPDNLPIERQVIDIPEEDKVCPETGKPLVKIGEEVTSKLAHKPGSFFIKQIIRPKYGLPEGEGVLTALLPDSLLERCQADESLLAEVVVKKFGDHLPLYRQAEIMAREGVYISRQLLSQWMLNVGSALKPLYMAMLNRVLQSNNIFYDETPLDMLKPGKGKTHQAYMWVLVGGETANPSYRVYDFCIDRCHYHAAEMLKNYHGRLHSDKYGAYETLANKKQLIWCPCWSHIRRKFIEAESGDPAFRQWVLRKIKYLFMLERIAWARSEEERSLRLKLKNLPSIYSDCPRIRTQSRVKGTALLK